MLNKKGIAVDDFIPLLITLFIFVIGIVFVLVASGLRSSSIEGNVAWIHTNLDMDNMVNNFLNQEIVYGGQTMEMVDWIATAEDDEEEKLAFLRKEIREFFGQVNAVWLFDVYFEEDRVFSAVKGPSLEEGIYRLRGCYDSSDYKWIMNLPEREVHFCYYTR